MENITLDKVKKGTYAVVTAVSSANKALAHKLLAMGLVSGTVVRVDGAAPLGDPIKIYTLGYLLSLRMSEAAGVLVRPLSNSV